MGHTGATNANRAEHAEASSSRERRGEREQRKAEGNVYAKDAIKNRRVPRGLPSQCDIFAFNFISLNTLQSGGLPGRDRGGRRGVGRLSKVVATP